MKHSSDVSFGFRWNRPDAISKKCTMLEKLTAAGASHFNILLIKLLESVKRWKLHPCSLLLSTQLISLTCSPQLPHLNGRGDDEVSAMITVSHQNRMDLLIIILCDSARLRNTMNIYIIYFQFIYKRWWHIIYHARIIYNIRFIPQKVAIRWP